MITNCLRSTPLLSALFISGVVATGCEELLTGFSGWGWTREISDYPTGIGNRWNYERSGWAHNFRITDTLAVIRRDTFRTAATVEVTGEVRVPVASWIPGDSILVSVFRETETLLSPGGGTFVSHRFMKMEMNTLLLHGYTGGGLVSPGPGDSRGEFVFRGQRFTHLRQLGEYVAGPFQVSASDSIVREIPPLVAIAYPLVKGRQWTFRPDGRPWRIDKRVGPMRTGTFAGMRVRYCEVRWLYNLNHDGSWDDDIWIIDRISEQGLMGRTIEVKDVMMTGPGGPEPIGYFDYREEISLTSIQLLGGGEAS